MNELRTIAEAIAENRSAVEQRIEQLWTDALRLVDDGDISQDTFNRLQKREYEWGDAPASRWVFSHYLAAMVASPGRLEPTDEQTYSCATCTAGRGWMEHVQKGGWFPCPACNAASYDLWKRGHYKANHECDQCRPGAKKRGKAGASAQEELRGDREEERGAYRRDLESSVF